MTGFGEGRAENERLEVVAVLRTVNHRFLDLSVRMPEEFRVHEPELIQRLRDALDRGRVELRVTVTPRGERAVRIHIDEEVAARYVEVSNRLAERDGVAQGLASGDLLRLPEVVSVEPADAGTPSRDKEALRRALDRALENLLAVRSREGADLAGALQRTVGDLTRVVSRLAQLRSGLQQTLYERTRDRLEDLAGEVGVDESRLAQEVALLVDRADVQEEIDRLNAHVGRFAALLGAEDAVGKRLDFLAQEILRELNTIGSKCRDSKATQLVLDGKVLCEQLREQVQNVE